MVAWIIVALTVVVLALFVFACVKHFKKDNVESDEIVTNLIMGIILTPVIGILSLAALLMACLVFTPYEVTGEVKSPLKALTVKTGTEGTYFLSSGNNGHVDIIKYISQEKSGSWSVNRVDAKYASIHEGEKGAPYVSQDIITQKISSLWLFTPIEMNTHVISDYEFHIPENSIAENFEVSVKK